MTHDIVKELVIETDLTLTEVLIYDFKEWTFFSKLVFEEDNIEVECRPSDAIAISLRCKSPIYVLPHILDEIGMFATIEKTSNIPASISANILDINRQRNRLEQLQTQLDRAVRVEDYEAAAKIRDEIKSYLEN
jgi:bifunctional DNase/RNase